jgi:hypothetical protein
VKIGVFRKNWRFLEKENLEKRFLQNSIFADMILELFFFCENCRVAEKLQKKFFAESYFWDRVRKISLKSDRISAKIVFF